MKSLSSYGLAKWMHERVRLVVGIANEWSIFITLNVMTWRVKENIPLAYKDFGNVPLKENLLCS